MKRIIITLCVCILTFALTSIANAETDRILEDEAYYDSREVNREREEYVLQILEDKPDEPVDPNDPHVIMAKALKTLDQDHDMLVSAQEFVQGFQRFKEMFGYVSTHPDSDSNYDFNSDGVIDCQDFGAFCIMLDGETEYGRFMLDDDIYTFSAILTLDNDGDGIISDDEACQGEDEFNATFGKIKGEEGYNKDYDFNKDDVVDENDRIYFDRAVSNFVDELQMRIQMDDFVKQLDGTISENEDGESSPKGKDADEVNAFKGGHKIVGVSLFNTKIEKEIEGRRAAETTNKARSKGFCGRRVDKNRYSSSQNK